VRLSRINRPVRVPFFLLVILAASLARAGDWPQFLGPFRNNTLTNVSLADWPADGPKKLWEKSVGQGFAGPVVVSNRVVLFHRVDDMERVSCFNATDGAEFWKTDAPTAYRDDFGFDEGPRATPAIDSGRVFTYGAEGKLQCLEFATGKRLWNVDCREKLGARKGWFGIACSPLVENGRVFLNTGGTGSSAVAAFDSSSGKSLWKSGEDEASYSSPVTATLGGERLVLFFSRSGLLAVQPANGSVAFQFPWRSRDDASVNAATPIVVGNLIFLSASYGTGAVLLESNGTGAKKVWSSDEALSSHYTTSVYRDGFLYGFHGRQEMRPAFRCVEFKTGKVRWSRENFGAGNVLLLNDTLLILTERGELIRAKAAPERWDEVTRAQILPAESRAFPAVADGRFYARSRAKLVCLGL
jgi:outer membrane protein assembly factor BamB